MKVEVSALRKKFNPITLTITIETREELLDMYARNSFSNDDVVELIKDGDYGFNSSVTSKVGKSALIAACRTIPDSGLDVPILVALKKAILG